MKKRTRYVLLGLLRDEDMNGYEIKKNIENRMKFFWNESYGQIYPELKRLVEEGKLKKYEDEKNTTKRNNFKYSITEEGLREFNRWMKADCEDDSVRSEKTLKYFLATDDNKIEIINNLKEDIISGEETVKLLKTYKDQIKKYINCNTDRTKSHDFPLSYVLTSVKFCYVIKTFCNIAGKKFFLHAISPVAFYFSRSIHTIFTSLTEQILNRN